MSFTGPTTQKNVLANGSTFKLFLMQQNGGYWVATFLWIKDSVAKAHHESRLSKVESYDAAVEWIHHNIDANASVDPL